MFFSERFICASLTKNQYEKHVSAPLFRRVFVLRKKTKSYMRICGLGFYRVFLNGKEITKGRLAPYISNSDDVIYYDTYDVEKYIRNGQNTLCILLGNGLQNGIGGEEFGFDKANWMSSPKFAISFFVNDKLLFEADESFECCESPITFDDLWAGEHYDARKEKDEKWQPIVKAETPKGEKRDASNLCVQVKKEVYPKKIIPYKNGYIFDFGLNSAGICRLKICANAGQKISLYHFEIFQNGEICTDNISFGNRTKKNYWQRDEYVTKDGQNVYEPSFTYHGFRYVYVEGLTQKQIKKSTLTMLVLSSSAQKTLRFSCSDRRLEKLFSMIVYSNESNFLYYPTDCPHREKNGWTGDAMLSAEQMLFSADYSKNLKEWLVCIRKSQRKNGQLPRIIPSTEWGFVSGESGPNWDGALIEITYQIYKKEGDTTVLKDNLPAIEKYLRYLYSKRNADGLIAFGLGDREETFTNESSAYETPNEVTDTLATIELLDKTEKMANEVSYNSISAYAREFKEQLKSAFKTKRIDSDLRVIPFTQTGQCMLVCSKLLDGDDAERAFKNLVDLLKKDNVIKMGVLGYRRLFDTLAENGEIALAYKLTLSENYSGYLYYVKKGMTSMPESFLDYEEGSFVRKDGGKPLGLNHHWYGHILGSLLKYIVGINFDCYREKRLTLSPFFINGINKMRVGLVIDGKNASVSWKRRKDKIYLKIKSKLPISINDSLSNDYIVKEKKIINGKLYTLKND